MVVSVAEEEQRRVVADERSCLSPAERIAQMRLSALVKCSSPLVQSQDETRLRSYSRELRENRWWWRER